MRQRPPNTSSRNAKNNDRLPSKAQCIELSTRLNQKTILANRLYTTLLLRSDGGLRNPVEPLVGRYIAGHAPAHANFGVVHYRGHVFYSSVQTYSDIFSSSNVPSQNRAGGYHCIRADIAIVPNPNMIVDFRMMTNLCIGVRPTAYRCKTSHFNVIGNVNPTQARKPHVVSVFILNREKPLESNQGHFLY